MEHFLERVTSGARAKTRRPISRRGARRRSCATAGRATCASSRTPASASRRRARAARCASAAWRRASCSVPARSAPDAITPADVAGACRAVADLARRSAARARGEPDRLGAQGEQRQQVEGRRTAANQAVDAGRSDQALRSRARSPCIGVRGRRSLLSQSPHDVAISSSESGGTRPARPCRPWRDRETPSSGACAPLSSLPPSPWASLSMPESHQR